MTLNPMNSIGCAYYDSENGVLYLMEDAIDTSGKQELVSMRNFLHIGHESLDALQIFELEAHANVHSSKTKEGLSLYGILNECVTYAGKMLLKHWLLRPSTLPEVIGARADAVECFLRPENEECLGRIRQCLKQVANLPRTIIIISSGKGRVGEWRALLNFIRASEKIRSQAGLIESPLSLIARISSQDYTSELEVQAQKIDDVIDWDESKLNAGRVTVRTGVDDHLDELRENYAGLESKLEHLARKLGSETPFEFVHEFVIVYYPQIGYLCSVRRLSERPEAEVFMQQGWEFQFSNDTHDLYKNDYMRDLDHYIGDLTTSITDREIEIVNALEGSLEKLSPILLILSSALAELDCLLSLARVAHLREWVRPEIVEENLIQIQNGRHPLVEACVESYISNDTILVGGQGLKDDEPSAEEPSYRSMVVITGANFSGKSVYLKQVALIVILAQIGSYVPASGAQIGIHDAIFTRVTTTESSSRNASAFMIDLQQVSFMLRNCTQRSLLLIDEFGKGTDPIDGQALFCSLVQHLIKRGRRCPKTILSTHFHAVFSSGLMPRNLPIEYSHMSIVLSGPTRAQADVEPTYLYKLAPGLVTSSHALGCAALFGAPIHVRLRASRVSELLSKHEGLELIDEQLSEEATEEMNRLESVVRRFLETDFGDEGDVEDVMMGESGETAPNEVMRHLREVILQLEEY
ncbi:hypothetical protein CROQUDRAFT_668766 [Cronartium quercuum f. sp. fusiforme G11]|uniref:DNA mismatch repair proteins mutS family domain-containing protein n=1 Tax=Cronartium quercuum f. sp. fusiforme G11 TaxID=708437 RepID=A0A9P6NPZ8_9BASI|nr:hypothetical protein CROQUDRAFT_668766 [Cronartium quercuum f. sp. fusiforme G11]